MWYYNTTLIFQLICKLLEMYYMITDSVNKDFQLHFGKKLKEIRTLKKLSYRQLDALTSLDHSYISKIEKGDINVTLDTVLELAKGLKVTTKELFDFEFYFEDK